MKNPIQAAKEWREERIRRRAARKAALKPGPAGRAGKLVRSRAKAWHEGQVRVLTYPHAVPVMFVGPIDGLNDIALNGREVRLGQYLVKGPAGDIEPMPIDMFLARFEAVAA